MKYIFLGTVMLFSFIGLFLMTGGITNQSTYMQEYKRALDAGTDAASKHTAYWNMEHLNGLSFGFGEGLEDENNIQADRQEALDWFYRVFYRSLKLENNPAGQERLKRYIPMKCLVTYHNISIANQRDEWVVDKDFVLEYAGREYLFTLSGQMMDRETGEWKQDAELGLTAEERQKMVVSFIQTEIEEFLRNRENQESGNIYALRLGLSDADQKFQPVNGTSFIVLCEGLPMPGLNLFQPKQKLYAFSLGGTEIIRAIEKSNTSKQNI